MRFILTQVRVLLRYGWWPLSQKGGLSWQSSQSNEERGRWQGDLLGGCQVRGQKRRIGEGNVVMPEAFQSRNEELKCQVRSSRKVGRAGKITGWLICAVK